MRRYTETEIRRAVAEVVAAGMEKFLYQEPFSSESSRQSARRKSYTTSDRKKST
ncbi:hypothetical protein KHA94_18535 [Bacillus sp. FJAT-49705]|uniref:Uncharacterized protein n=1 Tax=Cytobacillus citreus TaxID=2833586 RepID=A0ABS5NWF0_9BACI|nr:hypothetical protein [Cytobacillus citreus]MBS4192167.1 hypothetical protein [Cytobacillus citreus]